MNTTRLTDKLPKPVDLEARYDDMIDECYSFKDVGGPFAFMLPSTVLKECDPIAYRCGLSDWEGEEFTEFDNEYYDKCEFSDALDECIEEIESEIEELEEEREALDGCAWVGAPALDELKVELEYYKNLDR